ncbi:MAG: lipocalin family protein [Chloroflexota bacterium]|nr:lipocalin family protein [Chloroflexota bacterium]
MRVLLMLIVMFTLACGDDDKPTAPTPDPEPDPAARLIGTWKYTGNDFYTKVVANLREHLIGEGLTTGQTDMVVSDLLGDPNETFSLTLDFRTDGTVIVDNEQTDRYRVSGNQITVTSSDGETFTVNFEVSDTTLTLRYPVAPLLATVGLNAEDEEEAELLRAMLKGIEFMTMFFSKV